MEIFGLPAHVLVVHAAVVLTPLAVLATLVFAVVPKWRYLTRWPAALLAVLATGAVWTARITGKSFFDKRFASLPGDNSVREAIVHHQSLGNVLSLVVIAFLVLTLLGVWLLGGPSGFASGWGAKPRGEDWVELVVPIALVVVSLVTLVYVILTGDAGARAAWNPPTS